MRYDYQDTKIIDRNQLKTLYASVGWSAYTEDIKKLIKGISVSLKVVSVWCDNQLIGLIRVIGDGQTIIYIQDLLVNPTFQGLGLGSALVEKVLEDYQHVRQIVLLTEEAPKVRNFYEKHGFKSCNQGQVVAFALLK